MNRADLIARLNRYRDRYLDPNDADDSPLDNLQETPEANELIEKFIDRIVLGC
jgi:GMP synthase (glutamine-hydrolysing)